MERISVDSQQGAAKAKNRYMPQYARALAIAACGMMIFAGLPVMAKGDVAGIGSRIAATVAFVLAAGVVWWLEYRSKRNEHCKKQPRKEGFDWGMHYFRAFAIVLIMAMHYCASFGYDGIVNGLLHSSTIYFLFISGYLCQYIDSRRRDRPLAYYRKKLLNVICPFLLFSLLFGMMKGIAGFNGEFLANVLCGRVQGQYWYIPFVAGLFLISPWLCRLDARGITIVAIASLFAFLLFPIRPAGFAIAWPHTFYLYTYFSFFYIIGFVYCRYKANIDLELCRYRWVVYGAALLAAGMLWWAPMCGLKFPDYAFAVGLQKFIIIVAVVQLLSALKDKKIWMLDKLAKYSFTLYFIHYGVFAQTHGIHDSLLAVMPLPPMWADTIAFALYVTVLLLAAIVVKTALGRYSRWLIGS